MRHFPLTSMKNKFYFRSGYPYILRLDQELTSIHDYINGKNPNYHILNYTSTSELPYYTTAELMEKNVLAEAYIYDTTQELPTTIDHTSLSLLVFPSHLTYHQGLLNNFTGYLQTGLVFIPYHDLIKMDGITFLDNILLIPDYLVPTATALGSGMSPEVTRIMPGDFDPESNIDPTQDDNNEFGISGYDYMYGRFAPLGNGGNQDLSSLRLVYNQYRLISYDDSFTLMEGSLFKPFAEAHFIISQARMENNLDNPQAPARLNPKNYLYCRLAGSAPYYRLAINHFTYTDHAAAKYGSSNLFVGTSQPIRIAFTTCGQQDISTNSASWMAYELPYRGILMNEHGTPGLGDTNISHHISLETNNYTTITSEEIFTEHFDSIDSFSFEKNKIPYYTININEGTSLPSIQEKDKTFVMVSIG